MLHILSMTEATKPTMLDYKPGMIVKVNHKIKELTAKGEEKERIQTFEGTIMAVRHNKEIGATITVRKISEGVGVEKIFPIYAPIIESIELVRTLKTRRAKLTFLRDKDFKRKIKEVKAPVKK